MNDFEALDDSFQVFMTTSKKDTDYRLGRSFAEVGGGRFRALSRSSSRCSVGSDCSTDLRRNMDELMSTTTGKLQQRDAPDDTKTAGMMKPTPVMVGRKRSISASSSCEKFRKTATCADKQERSDLMLKPVNKKVTKRKRDQVQLSSSFSFIIIHFKTCFSLLFY